MLDVAFAADTTMLAVMSFNRGKYLRNCMRSIQRHMSGFNAVIFDDHSTHHDTQHALRELSSTFQVADCRADSAGDRGGLHANMNRALDLATHDGYRFVFFVQDDTQVVRDVDADFIESVNAIFNCDRRVAQVGAMFYKGYWPKQVMQARIGLNRQHGYYQHIPGPDWTCGIVDCGITSLERIAAKGFRFQESEASSILKSESLDLHRADCRDPVMMFTPWPETTGRNFGEARSIKQIARQVLINVQEYGAGAGCHPFLPMSPEAIARLKQRPLDQYPIAEHFLAVEKPLRQPWWYSACNNISDFRSFKSFLSFKWFTGGPANYRANVRRQHESDEQWARSLSQS